MNVLVVGGTGATGIHVVRILLEQGHRVKAVVRNSTKLQNLKGDLELIEASLLDLPESEIVELITDVDAVISCLGHNLTFKGIYGKPRMLVRDAVQKLCTAIERSRPEGSVKFVLMNTTGNRNRDLNEKVSFAHKLVLGIIRVLVPPQMDNEKAADYLRVKVGQAHPQLEWVAVRPDGLINEETVSKYEIHESPIRDAIFDAGQVSRINVAHFMTELIIDKDLWSEWKGRMPVIYSTDSK